MRNISTMNRRAFLRMAAISIGAPVAAGLLSACGATPTPTAVPPTPTKAPVAQPTAVPAPPTAAAAPKVSGLISQ